MRMSIFRHLIQQRDKRCLISGICSDECDARIISAKVCEKYAPQFLNDPRNGLFLNKNLHNSFDRFWWTFDIYDIQRCEHGQGHDQDQGRDQGHDHERVLYQYRVITFPSHKHRSIDDVKSYITLPLECFPFLYVHYQMYLLFHYQHKSTLLDSDYQELLETDPVFRYLLDHEIPIDALLGYTFQDYLLKHRLLRRHTDLSQKELNAVLKEHDSNYLIWWDHLPLSYASWEPRCNLNEQTVNEYHQRIESLMDEDYT